MPCRSSSVTPTSDTAGDSTRRNAPGARRRPPALKDVKAATRTDDERYASHMDGRDERFKRVVIAGGAGFLGRSLTCELAPLAQEIVVLTRGPARADGNVRHVNWDARTPGPWVRELE